MQKCEGDTVAAAAVAAAAAVVAALRERHRGK